MSGRSAYVRKEKTKTKDEIVALAQQAARAHPQDAHPVYNDFPSPRGQFHDAFEQRPESKPKSIASRGSHDDAAYARARRPQIPNIDVSGIEKSTFRSKMDKRSENVRKNLAKTFTKKKNGDEDPHRDLERSTTSHTMRPGDESTVYTYEPLISPRMADQRSPSMLEGPENIQAMQNRALPPTPAVPPMRRWLGSGKPPQSWNKLRKVSHFQSSVPSEGQVAVGLRYPLVQWPKPFEHVDCSSESWLVVVIANPPHRIPSSGTRTATPLYSLVTGPANLPVLPQRSVSHPTSSKQLSPASSERSCSMAVPMTAVNLTTLRHLQTGAEQSVAQTRSADVVM